jgi:hypothetical protein
VKSLFAIAFSSVYLTLTVGVAKTTHYCMGRENHTAFFSFHADPCACFKLMGGNSGCCENESVLLQVDDDQSASTQINIPPIQLTFIFEFQNSIRENSTLSINQEFSPEKFLRPPPQKAYIKNCSLIFYERPLASSHKLLAEQPVV